MAWRVARSLDTLLGQINGAAPSRSRVADGSIGDAEHASRASDHNPDSRGIVHARDYTHDPSGRCDMNTIMGALAASVDYRIKYLIWNRRITQWQSGRLAWVSYSGSNPHTAHGHVSVNTAGEDDTRPWNIGGTTGGDDELSAQFESNMAAWTRMRDARDRQLDADLRADLAWKAQQIADLTAKVDQLLQQSAQNHP